MRLDIECQISDVYMEIYSFSVNNDTIDYVGIMFSRRKNKNDIWGHLWKEYYEKKKDEELTILCETYGYSDDDPYNPNFDYNPGFEDELEELKAKYNPVCNYVAKNVSYYNGTFGGHRKHTPKLTADEIRKEICKKINSLKVKF